MKIIKSKIVQFVLIIAIPTIYSLGHCPEYNEGDDIVSLLTYNQFRDSTDKEVQIYDDLEQPVSLSSFFITRNKQPIYEHICNTNGGWYERECLDLNKECEQHPKSSSDCILSTQKTKSPALFYLDVSNGSLQNLHPNTFITVSECLETLILKENAISKIPQKAFFSLNNLNYLDLSHNKLTRWDNFILENMSLGYLNISYNQIGEFNGTADIKVLIESLDISHNNLLHFDINDTTAFLFLNYLNVAHNKLESIHLSNTMSLQTLDISHNYIKSLKNCILNSNYLNTLIASHNNIYEFDTSDLTGLRSLNLSHNHIEFINSKTLTSLIDLDLSNNKIILLPNMFEHSLNLVTLLLNNNAINDVPVNTFYGLINLKTLSLANNNLKSFEFGSFSGLINLETLDLSYNEIIEFESDKFMDLNNLQTLLLDGNQCNNHLNLTDLNVKLGNLRTIGLTNMFWSCERLVKTKIELRKMNISLKHSSVPNQLNYNIDGISCVPLGYDSTNYFKKLFKQTTKIQPVVVVENVDVVENVIRNVRHSNNFTNTTQYEHITPAVQGNETSINQFVINSNIIDYNNTSIPPLFEVFLQKVNSIIKNETTEIKNSLQKLDNTTSLLLHKLERLEELNHLKLDAEADTLIHYTTANYDFNDFELSYAGTTENYDFNDFELSYADN